MGVNSREYAMRVGTSEKRGGGGGMPYVSSTAAREGVAREGGVVARRTR